MAPTCLYNYCRERLSNIEKQFGYSAESGGIDSIHDLRVEIKRIRALFDLVECINDNFSAGKTFRAFRPLFKSAGKVRDYQVQMLTILKAMKEHRLNLSEYYNFLKMRVADCRQNYFDFCRNFKIDITRQASSTVHRALHFLEPDYIVDRMISSFLSGLQEIVLFKRKSHLEPKDYHRIRIGSKAARYNLEVVRLCLPENARYFDLNDALKAIHQVLGIWHDKEIGLQLLDQYRETHAPDELFDDSSFSSYREILEKEKLDYLDIFENRWGHFTKLLEIYGFLDD